MAGQGLLHSWKERDKVSVGIQKYLMRVFSSYTIKITILFVPLLGGSVRSCYTPLCIWELHKYSLLESTNQSTAAYITGGKLPHLPGVLLSKFPCKPLSLHWWGVHVSAWVSLQQVLKHLWRGYHSCVCTGLNWLAPPGIHSHKPVPY